MRRSNLREVDMLLWWQQTQERKTNSKSKQRVEVPDYQKQNLQDDPCQHHFSESAMARWDENCFDEKVLGS